MHAVCVGGWVGVGGQCDCDLGCSVCVGGWGWGGGGAV